MRSSKGCVREKEGVLTAQKGFDLDAQCVAHG